MKNFAVFSFFASCLLILTLLSSCDEPPFDPAAVEGNDWELVSYQLTGGETVPAHTERASTLMMKEGQLSGSTGCNRMNGSYTMEEQTLTVGPLMTTKMACQGMMKQENAVLSIIQATPELSMDKEQLIFSGAKGRLVYQQATGATTAVESDVTSSPEASGVAAAAAKALPDFPDTEPVVRGMFRYMADAALIINCEDGQRYPVAMAAGFPKLERAYLDLMGEDAGRAAYLTAKANWEERDKMEGGGQEKTLVVEEWISLTREADCETERMILMGTYTPGENDAPARFQTCDSGDTYPVQWLTAASAPAKSLMKAEGFLLGGPAPEGDGAVDYLHITRVIGQEEGGSCN